MNLADEHLLKALVLCPTLLNTMYVKGDLPKCLTFESWYRYKSNALKTGQYATSFEIAQSILKDGERLGNPEVTRLGNQILNIMRGNGRRVP